MSKDAVKTKAAPKKRGQGRPVSGENDVGRDRLLNAAEKLLRIMPPARVTTARIAQEANADPALVRYYFGNRTALLMAIVDRVTAHESRGGRKEAAPVGALATHIAQTVALVQRAPFMHRLMHDELTDDGTEESRASVRKMNTDLVGYYTDLLAADGGMELIDTNPLFLHLVVLGASDFFSSAGPLIGDMLPKGVSIEKLAEDFQEFLVKLVLDGLRKR